MQLMVRYYYQQGLGAITGPQLNTSVAKVAHLRRRREVFHGLPSRLSLRCIIWRHLHKSDGGYAEIRLLRTGIYRHTVGLMTARRP